MYRIVGLSVVAMALALSSAAAGAASATVSVTATVISKNQCKFNSPTAALAFNPINPADPSPAVTAHTSITFKCGGSSANATFSVSHDGGQNGNRMLNTTQANEYLPYTLTLSPQTATVPKNVVQTLNIDGSIAQADFQNAYVGAYADTVVLTVVP